MKNKVRVFLSSTFLDFARERELIHTEVVPTLDDMCRHFGLSLEFSDLRWGVTAKDVNNHRTVEICLEEVDLCRQLSPELNFLLLLGDRAGSRFISDRVPVHALKTLLEDLTRAGPQDAQAWTLADRLLTLFPPSGWTRAGVLVRDDSPSGQALAETILNDPATAQSLTSFWCADPSAEDLRISLAFSLTHQEVFRSGALASRNPNDGAIAILRTVGQSDELQHKMRVKVSRAFGDRAAELNAVMVEPGRFDTSYEKAFVSRCMTLLGTRVQAARKRGSRSHHFAGMPSSEQGLPLKVASCHQQALEKLGSWACSDSGPRAAAIVGGMGSGRTTVLRCAKSMVQSLEIRPRTVHLEVQTSPELRSLRNLIITLIAWASSAPLSETEIRNLSSALVRDLISRATHELGQVERADRLFVLIDDLDLVVDGGSPVALSWLWSDTSSRKVLFTCGASLAQELSESADVELIQLNDLSDAELLVVAREACEERMAPWLDSKRLAEAARTQPTPGYIHSIIEGALHTDEGELEQWASRGFYNHFLGHLFDSAPFSRSISNLFLGLSTGSEHGVAEQEFLSICYDWKEIREELLEHFPVTPFAGRVPPLVWHRLASHFRPAIEIIGGYGAIASRVRAPFAAAVTEGVGSGVLRSCKERLAEYLLAGLGSPSERATLVLPSLLTSIERDEVLAQLVLAKPFMKISVWYDSAEALVWAISRSPAHNAIVKEIVRGSLAPGESNAKEESHWLLDASILTRKLGHYNEAGDLARRAFEIRSSYFGGLDPLTVAAVAEATMCDLDAGRYASAERMCKAMLQLADQDNYPTAALLGLKSNLASALTSQQRYAEAEPLLRELLALYEKDGKEAPELFEVYNGLGICHAKLGALDEAKRCATKSVALASRFYGRGSQSTAAALATLGGILLDSGDPAGAASVLERSLQFYLRVLDENHPLAVNAEVGYFLALSKSSRVPDAIGFVADRLGRINSFYDCIPWFHASIGGILQIVDGDDAVRFRSLYSPIDRLAAASRGEVWTGSFASRATQMFAGTLGLSDEKSVEAFLLTGIFLWVLAVLAATLRDLITRDEAEGHVRMLEARLAAIPDEPATFHSLQNIMRMAWQKFAGEYVALGDCERLLLELCPQPLPAGLPAAFDAQGSQAPAIEEMKRSADDLGNSAGAASVERAQALMMLAARAASAGQYDEAIAAQVEVAEIASKLHGPDSRHYTTARINLGAVFFRASRYDEAFEHYSEGVQGALRAGAPLDVVSSIVENLSTAGFKAGKFNETGETLRICAELVYPSPAAMTLWVLSVSALVRAGSTAGALDGFERAMDVHAQMSPREGEAWLEPILAVAGGLCRQLGESEKVRFSSMLRRFTENARAKGWFESLSQMQGWIGLQAVLNL